MIDRFLFFVILSIFYSQLINIFETVLWIRGFWKIKPPFPTSKGDVKNEGYHLLLAFLYFMPFTFLEPEFIKTIPWAWLVWILNDVTWHFWSVYPRYWKKWIIFYFNPRLNVVLWFARFLIIKVKVTPRRMFYITLIRLMVLPFLFMFMV
ncbi:MAG: hypothetical protein J7K23_00530 [Thermoproteales archaeon]|nr:hypothetical protein [Thermoproteales archaeon]